MDAITRAIEVGGRIGEDGCLFLDQPLPAVGPGRVRVIILLAEQAGTEPADPSCRVVESAAGSCYLEDPEEPVCEAEPFCESG